MSSAVPAAERATAVADALAAERVRLARTQAGVVRLPHGIALAALSWVGHGAGIGPAGLLLFVVSSLLLIEGRFIWLRRQWPTDRAAVRRLDRRLGNIGMLSALPLAGLALAAGLQPVSPAHYLLGMLITGNAAGAVAPAAGDTRGYFGYALLLGLGQMGSWWLVAGPAGLLPGALIVVLLALLLSYVREQGRAQRALIQANLDLEAAREVAEAANLARTRFFAAASHDLRQPLTALGYHAATLQALAQRPGADALLPPIAQGLQRALAESQQLLASLLEISQLDAGAVRAQREPVALQPLLKAMVQDFAPQAHERGLALHLALPAEPASAWADGALLRRVLHNLVGNALKFTEQGEVRLSLQAEGSGTWRLQVSDTGPGIPAEQQAAVFEEFVQLGNAARDRAQGLGLGLAIVRRLTALMQLPLSLSSAPGAGAAFTLQLARAPAAPAPGPLPPGTAPSPRRERRALVVDDEAALREALALLLSTQGWQVQTAASAEQAERLLAIGPTPDALLLDFRLGQDDGLALLARLRAAGCAAPAWLLTGDTAPERILQAQAAGVPVLYKPVEGAVLLAALQDA